MCVVENALRSIHDLAATEAAPLMTIDGRAVPIEGERNVLEVARKAGVDIPNFCYHSELSVYGACRLCLVEIEGRGLVASCSTAPEGGMAVRTNTPRVQRLRRTILELLLADHDRECTTCVKSGACRLQELANRFGVKQVRFGERDQRLPLDTSSPSLTRDPNKCILCGDCVRVCQELQGIGAIDFAFRGAETSVVPAFGRGLGEVECVNCGQCAQVCPTGALTVKSEVDRVWAAIHDPDLTVVVQVAPAVRVALGEQFGLDPGAAVAGKTVAALKGIGFDRVFDTNVAADLTAWEETHEFLRRRAEVQGGAQCGVQGGAQCGAKRLPLFTSCCPGWVKYCEQYHADLLGNVSTCRSPQQMLGSLLKTYWAPRAGLDPAKVFVVSVMPCTAKKYEAARPEFAVEGRPDVDCVLSTSEVAAMVRETGLDFGRLDDQPFDSPLGLASGAAVIFGATGGVAEAVVRTVAGIVHGQEAPRVDFEPVRGLRGVKEAAVRLGSSGEVVRIGVVHGLANAGRVIADVKSGAVSYDIIEVMACPGGCVGGGGQPPAGELGRLARLRGLYRLDRQSQLHRPQDNPQLARLYQDWLGEAGSDTAHNHLHTHYHPQRRLDGGPAREADSPPEGDPLPVQVCVGTGCYTRGSYQVLHEFTRLVAERGLGERVRLGGTFCLERCDRGVSIRVGDRIVTGVRPETAAEVFGREVENRLSDRRSLEVSSPGS